MVGFAFPDPCSCDTEGEGRTWSLTMPEPMRPHFNPDRHHRRSIRLQGHDYATPGAYFVTICAIDRLPLFSTISDGDVALTPCGDIVAAAWHNLPRHYRNLSLDAFVVMPNHIHGILQMVGPPVGAGLNFDRRPATVPTGKPPCRASFGSPIHPRCKDNATPCPKSSGP